MLNLIGGILLIIAGGILSLLGMGIFGDLGTDRGHHKAMIFVGVVAVFGGIGLIWKFLDAKTLKNLDEKDDEIFLHLLKMQLAKETDQSMVDYCMEQGHEPETAEITVDMIKITASENDDKNLPDIITQMHEMHKADIVNNEIVNYCMQQGLPQDLAMILVNGLPD